ncbi:hypothetical protein ADILRU_2139 [Leifsonia rubra CMS 76R]|nr:hypothetical protein ADILRU_2139 [Leifsonia rubra CMS 76R]
MIQWWGWLLIWVGLVLALLVVLIFLAFRLFRQAIAIIHELSALADKTTALDTDGPALDTDAAAPSALHRAVFVEMSQIRAQYDTQQRRRAELKNERHERRIARAKRIITHDAHTAQWPESWS